MADIRLPNITEATTEGQLRQMKDYLYQLTGQLNFALKSTEEQEKTYKVSIQSRGKGANGSSVAKGSSQKSAEEMFFDLKDLIIKSADIVNAYYDIIERKLSGKYVAESDFGTYKKTTEKYIKETSEYTQELYTSIQTIDNKIDEKSEIRSQFYIKTGWLDDGNTIGGIELGQSKTSDDGTDVGFARFTKDALTFYDGSGMEESNKLAWFANNHSYFRNVTMEGNVQLEGYTMDTSNGLAFKWIGR